MKYQLTLKAVENVERETVYKRIEVTKFPCIRARNNKNAVKKAKRMVKKMNRGRKPSEKWKLARIDEVIVTETIRCVASEEELNKQ